MNEKVFYGVMKRDGWSVYLAASEEGLLYVGSENEDKNEIEKWVMKSFPAASLVEDWSKVEPYAKEFAEYMNGERKQFTMRIVLRGTPFQESVWTELQTIPYGETRTYSEIAEKIGKPDAVRAVGTAIGANPALIVIPCHRVISKSGKLSGFRGGIPMKEKLLIIEGIVWN